MFALTECRQPLKFPHFNEGALTRNLRLHSSALSEGKGEFPFEPLFRKRDAANMAIYSCNISNVSRAKGSSSCATLSYISAERVSEERTGELYQYGRSERVVATNTLLPQGAPTSYQDPKILFNAIENYEKADNARTAKKIMVALPREFDIEKQKEVVEAYIKNNLTSQGYAATYAIHCDKENNNPHAHILVANRQINEKGEWSSKRKMEYALDEKGNRIPRLDENGQQKTDKNGRKQWVRINAEQNPLDKREMLVQLREQWAIECNKHLEAEQQIDHRSNIEQGKEEKPTIHEGWIERKIEARGGTSEKCEYNRQIQESNRLLSLLRWLKNELKEVSDALKSLIQQEKGERENARIEELLKRRNKSKAVAIGYVGGPTDGERTISETDTDALIREAKAGIDSATAGQNDTATLIREATVAEQNTAALIRESTAAEQASAAARANREAERERQRAEESRRMEEAARRAEEVARRERERTEERGFNR